MDDDGDDLNCDEDCFFESVIVLFVERIKKQKSWKKKGFGGCSLEQYLKEKREQIKKKTR